MWPLFFLKRVLFSFCSVSLVVGLVGIVSLQNGQTFMIRGGSSWKLSMRRGCVKVFPQWVHL